MKLKIDEEKCIGCGTCAIVCEKCFKMEGNVAKVVGDECAACDPKEAIKSCPVGAIEEA